MYLPEADQALADAQDARARGAYLRKELKDAIDRTDKLTRAAHKSVNDGITQKYSETITLKVCQRWSDLISISGFLISVKVSVVVLKETPLWSDHVTHTKRQISFFVCDMCHTTSDNTTEESI